MRNIGYIGGLSVLPLASAVRHYLHEVLSIPSPSVKPCLRLSQLLAPAMHISLMHPGATIVSSDRSKGTICMEKAKTKVALVTKAYQRIMFPYQPARLTNRTA